ncbi:MAG: ATP-binding protein [Clostridia bacterium]|nr:ATP-binding protein [Clostridia bacterium]
MKTEIRNILEEYTLRRQSEERRINALLNKLMDENPDFRKARQEYSSARAKAAIKRLEGGKESIAKAKDTYNKSLLAACKKSSVDEKELEVKYVCKNCKDTGYTGDNEKSFCKCVVNRITEKSLSSRNIQSGSTFDKFDENIFPDDEKTDSEGRTQRGHILHIKERAVKWCSAFPETNRLQTIFAGATGVGKSFMAGCIANDILKKGYSVVNTTAGGINDAMLKIINDRDSSVMGLFKSCDLLVIDDLGVEPMIKNITIETLYDIIEYRLSNKKHTIFCTNLSLPMIEERYGARVFSRISSTKNTAFMQVQGKDIRRL